jgi:hypothetical protein
MVDFRNEVEELVKNSKKLLHYKEINRHFYDKYGVVSSGYVYVRQSDKCERILPGFYVHKENLSKFDQNDLILQIAKIFEVVLAEVKKYKSVSTDSMATKLYHLGYNKYFSLAGLQFYLSNKVNLNDLIELQFSKEKNCNILIYKYSDLDGKNNYTNINKIDRKERIIAASYQKLAKDKKICITNHVTNSNISKNIELVHLNTELIEIGMKKIDFRSLKKNFGVETIRDFLNYTKKTKDINTQESLVSLDDVTKLLNSYGIKTNKRQEISKPNTGNLEAFFEHVNEEEKYSKTKEDNDGHEPEEILKANEIKLDSLSLSVRLSNCLKKAELLTLDDVIKYTERRLLEIRGFGNNSLIELHKILKEYGLCLPKNEKELIKIDTNNNDIINYLDQKDIDNLLRYYKWFNPILVKFLDVYTDSKEVGICDVLGIDYDERYNTKISHILKEIGFKTFGEIYENLIDSLSYRYQFIVLNRVHSKNILSLEAIGIKFNITRERVRQLEKKAKDIIRNRLSKLDAQIQTSLFKNKLAKIVHYNTANSIIYPFVSNSKYPSNAIIAIFKIVGNYILDNHWLISRKEYYKVVEIESNIKLEADPIGRIDDGIVDKFTKGLFSSIRERERFLIEKFKLKRVFGEWMLRDSQRSRTWLSLYKIGRPATKREIGDYAGINDLTRVSSYLSGNYTICRYDKTRWAFTDWTDDPYEGITKEIEQRIDDEGGRTTIDRLIKELPEKFGVAENSVRANLAVPKFVIEKGYVRFATTEEIRSTYFGEVETDPNAIQLFDKSWAAKILVEKRFFKGYSAKIPAVIAQKWGLKPGDSVLVPIEGTNFSASIIWRTTNTNQTIDLGRLAPILRELDIKKGEVIAVTFKNKTLRMYRLEDAPIIDNKRHNKIDLESGSVENLIETLFKK